MPVIVKAKFLRNGMPTGRAYSYITPDDGEEYKAGDYVYLNSDSVGQIVVTDVSEKEAGYPVDMLRAFVGRAEAPDLPVISKIRI